MRVRWCDVWCLCPEAEEGKCLRGEGAEVSGEVEGLEGRSEWDELAGSLLLRLALL